jgi:hypothetical protein
MIITQSFAKISHAQVHSVKEKFIMCINAEGGIVDKIITK